MKLILRVIIILLGIVVVGLLGYHFKTKSGHMNHTDHVKPEGFGSVEKFSFVDQNGNPFGADNLIGHSWIANFIFTRCAGPCPIMSRKMKEIQDHFGKNEKLKFISFSVDSDYDTPEILKKYSKIYGADKNWHFLTGPRAEIYEFIIKNFHLALEHPEGMDHEGHLNILHSLHFVLMDENLEIKGYFNSNDEESMEDLRENLKQISN